MSETRFYYFSFLFSKPGFLPPQGRKYWVLLSGDDRSKVFVKRLVVVDLHYRDIECIDVKTFFDPVYLSRTYRESDRD